MVSGVFHAAYLLIYGINRALCDLEASVSLMLYSICKKVQVGGLNPTTLSLQLADRFVKYPQAS